MDDLLVERKQHNQKKAQRMRPLALLRGALLFEVVCMRLVRLSALFYQKYGSCPEVLQKPSRPYACLAIAIDGITYAIPFRHHISHPYAFITYDRCGLDYSKAIVVEDPSYIESSGHVQIDQRDFNAIKGKESVITTGMKNYIKLYRMAQKHPGNPRYDAIRNYSTLQLFLH